MSSTKQLRSTLATHNAQPKKSLGQNFLVDENIARQIVAATNVSHETSVVEVGPGTGVLTKYELGLAHKVYAIELDERMLTILRDTFADATNLSLIHADILKVDLDALLADDSLPYVVLGNLPYYVTSHAIRKILESNKKPTCIVLMVQLEVARRMTATPDDMSLLAVGTQFYGAAEFLFHVKRSAFYPQPNVDSAVVRITPYSALPKINADHFFALAKAGFGQPRKQLRNTLATGLNLTREQSAELLLRGHVEPSRRPETLSIEEWVNLTKTYEDFFTPRA